MNSIHKKIRRSSTTHVISICHADLQVASSLEPRSLKLRIRAPTLFLPISNVTASDRVPVPSNQGIPCHRSSPNNHRRRRTWPISLSCKLPPQSCTPSEAPPVFAIHCRFPRQADTRSVEPYVVVRRRRRGCLLSVLLMLLPINTGSRRAPLPLLSLPRRNDPSLRASHKGKETIGILSCPISSLLCPCVVVTFCHHLQLLHVQPWSRTCCSFSLLPCLHARSYLNCCNCVLINLSLLLQQAILCSMQTCTMIN
jgi:hypothetical protein